MPARADRASVIAIITAWIITFAATTACSVHSWVRTDIDKATEQVTGA